ncbi:MAG: LysR family transcriptional regulator [Leptospiraceae bacterium]|nr:LysR family transcriptional regulator [Leptospiraceae bacterium]
MTLTQLRYIVAVDRHGSFARAAKQCLVTQPTLSLQVQKLEQEIGQEIFDRTRSPIVPTHYGRRIIEQARSVLREADRILEMFREDEEAPSGEISIGMIPTVSPYLMPHLYRGLTERYGRIDFKTFELPTTEIIERIRSGEMDLGILATPLNQKDIVETALYYEPFVAYFPEDYSGKRQNLSFQELDGYEMILLSQEHCFRNQALQVCGRRSGGRIECGSLETLKRMVDRGAGITLLPSLSVTDAEKNRIGKFKAPQPAREISLIHGRNFFKKKVFNAIRDLILESIPAALRRKAGRRVLGIEVD